ncbi:MAG: isoleucine--tRNA ligase [Candidatus Binatia bacterium]|nr:MAG: isoleucine--tRNA ligase [Candidatus Binatia bacterium]
MDYKQTLNLPKTDFPMRANLPEREPAWVERWENERLYDRLLEATQDRPVYVLHDGPPYANGHVHLGTALNKIIKDMVLKSKLLAGYRVPFVPGWDCHGMPIEHQVVRELGAKARQMSQLEIRQRCRAYAEKYIQIQRAEFKRLGVLGDWERPYLTMSPEYEAQIVRVFRELVERGFVYRGLRPVHWCTVCGTALAEAEVEYAEHVSPSIYVRFPFVGSGEEAQEIATRPEDRPLLRERARQLSVVIWTTTPWTLPANLAVCLNPHLDYVALDVDGALYIVAERLADAFLAAIGRTARARIPVDLRPLDGRDVFQHPFFDRAAKLIFESHVTADVGTGCVHTAPGHGYEDFAVGQKYGLPVLTPVDGTGRFTQEAGPFAGQPVFDANERIVSLLEERGHLLRVERLRHSYPHCWRCKQPLIFRATEQWFFKVDHAALRERALEEIDRVTWIPSWGHDRIYNMVQHRPDWCLSRQRAWGVPIPAFRCLRCNQYLFDPAVIRQVERVFAERGSDAWYELPPSDLLPAGTRCACGSADFEKDNNILDVWFDAGCSHVAVLEQRPELQWPADLYVEAVDQHRGWFQVSLLTSVATRDAAPYRSVLTHGLILDEAAKKMSKSLGNVIAPEEIIRQHGAEVLRLLFASVDYTADVSFSKSLIGPLLESYRKIRNTCRFLLGNLYDFDVSRHRVATADLPEIDRWILHRAAEFDQRVRRAYEQFHFHLVVHQLVNFCAVDLSALYLDIVKDRLYTAAPNSRARRAAQTVLFDLLDTLVRLMAPILSFTAEEVLGYVPGKPADSVFFLQFRDDLPRDEKLFARWEKLFEVRAAVTKALEEARRADRIGHSLDARVLLYASGPVGDLLREYLPELPAVFIVSQVEWDESLPAPTASPVLPDVRVAVERARGEKCQRCWNYSESVGQSRAHPGLCRRCVEVVEALARE